MNEWFGPTFFQHEYTILRATGNWQGGFRIHASCTPHECSNNLGFSLRDYEDGYFVLYLDEKKKYMNVAFFFENGLDTLDTLDTLHCPKKNHACGWLKLCVTDKNEKIGTFFPSNLLQMENAKELIELWWRKLQEFVFEKFGN